MKNILLIGIILFIISSPSNAQEIGTKQQGGIEVAPGLIIHPTLIELKINGKFKRKFTYSEALNVCRKLRTGGYNDWRVPTIVDLQNISRYAQDNRNWDGSYAAPIMPIQSYISSTTKKESNLFSTTEYRYFYLMISDDQTRKLGPQMELNNIEWDPVGRLIPVRYIR